MSAHDQRPPSRAAQLSALARAAEPPPLASTDARRMVRRAMLAGAARTSAQTARRGWLIWAAGAAAITLLALLPLVRDAGSRAVTVPAARKTGDVAANPGTPLELRLPGRDMLVATPGAKFELLNADARDRRISVQSGAVAFEVEPLARDQHFAAVTPHATVSVRGTVFSVEVDAQRTRVRVYEGVVVVAGARGERVMGAGETYASDGSATSAGPDAPLARPALAMARRRQDHAKTSASEAPPASAPAVSAPAVSAPALPTPPAPSVSARPAAPQTTATVPADAASLAQARAWLYEGQAEQALHTARTGIAAGEDRGAWLLVSGDALRSLGRHAQAAQAYRDAGRLLAGAPRVEAGFKAADVSLRVLDDARAALAALDDAAVDAPGSPLRERGLVLRIEAREALGESVAELALDYLTEYPASASAPRMRELVAR